MTHRFYLVDVFAEKPYAGNQLAVVVGEDGLPDETMQLLAAEMNYSETTFVSPAPEGDGGHRVRIFTPAREIAFAGHPILGTAWVLRQLVRGSSVPLHLNLGVGRVRVTFEDAGGGRDVLWFVAPTVSAGPTCAPERMAAALGIAPVDIDSASPVQQMSAGTSAMIVPLRSLAALRRSRLSLGEYQGLAAEGFPPLVYLFCRETQDPANDFSARFFFEAHGVREDPATGNGAAFLGAYLLDHKLVPGPAFTARIEQGHEVGRPSLVMLRGGVVEGRREISVGGSVIPTVHGELAQARAHRRNPEQESMTREYRIREAVSTDVDTLVAFTLREAREAEGLEADAEAVRRGVGGAFENPPRSAYWVAETRAGLAVASISVVTEWSNFRGGYYWWVQSVFVAPEHRHGGLVDRLLDHVSEAARAGGALDLRLYVHHSNLRARRAYLRCGFAEAPYGIMTRDVHAPKS